MKQKYFIYSLLSVLILFLMIVTVTALAQTSTDFDLNRHIIGSGGGESNSADFHVKGTIGQNVARPSKVDSADFTVANGFWVFEANTNVYLPMVIKN